MKEVELKKLTAVRLREIAHEEAGVQGASGMKKDELIAVLRTYFQGKGTWEEEPKVRDLSKTDIKKQIAATKAKRDEAFAAKDAKGLESVRRKMKHFKRLLKQHAP